MDSKNLEEQINAVCDAVMKIKVEQKLSYDKIVSKWQLGEDAKFSIDAKYLSRFLQRENGQQFLQRLLVLIRCAERTGIQLDFFSMSGEATAQEKIRRIKKIIEE